MRYAFLLNRAVRLPNWLADFVNDIHGPCLTSTLMENGDLVTTYLDPYTGNFEVAHYTTDSLGKKIKLIYPASDWAEAERIASQVAGTQIRFGWIE